MSNEIEAVQKIAIYLVPALLGILLHEIAHGYCAAKLGDPTAKAQGRLTLNPIPHIDPMGLLVFVITSLATPFVFGWAKPVPIDVRYFKKPRRDLMLTALAGPLTNFLLALCFALLLWLGLYAVPNTFWESYPMAIGVLLSVKAGIFINIGLAWLNLIPIPPLDGSKILAYFLPPKACQSYMQLERYGFILLLFLIISGFLSTVLTPLMQASVNLLLSPLH
ncbi:MAG: site-2 protease family protein [Desulfovibrio sp.]|nr:site-2 protease family protein [Desulfovibrio sp.]